MAFSLYDRFAVYINGALRGEASSVTVNYIGDPIPVDTLVKDLSGAYPVPKRAEVQIEEFSAAKGENLDVIKMWLNTAKTAVKVQSMSSGKALDAEGFVMPSTLSSSATDPAKLTFKVMCEAKDFA